MVDPAAVTDYQRREVELEEFLLFACFVANKPAKRTAQVLERFLFGLPLTPGSPLDRVATWVADGSLRNRLEVAATGQYTRLERCLTTLVTPRLDLTTCTVADLEAVPGIGPKTARFFILHTRPNQRYAVIDTHVLKELRRRGYTTQQQTPSDARKYRELETHVLALADAAGVSPAQYDLQIWLTYTRDGAGTAPEVGPHA